MHKSHNDHQKRADIRERVRRTFSEEERRLLDTGPTWLRGAQASRREKLAALFAERYDAECEEHLVRAPRLFDVETDADAPVRERPRGELVALMAKLADRCDALEAAGRDPISETQFIELFERLVVERIACAARSSDPAETSGLPLWEVDAALTSMRGRR